jgi:hypothetical protein
MACEPDDVEYRVSVNLKYNLDACRDRPGTSGIQEQTIIAKIVYHRAVSIWAYKHLSGLESYMARDNLRNIG